MRPLVYWCRWHEAKLRLHGRSETAVWGELAFPDGNRPFHFDLQSWLLTIGQGEETRRVRLDEMGVEKGD
ncbi:MAG: hypothetical protein L0332_07785 [Chloroflexi bacterium]|nr:hypothetical protein [Chloroflexota bacterium]MCI0578253.1 hypothetical protein [Chloroflexota bacterium]MCI0643498.1 hypothetical protein [Chloroflexota bacterium]MCI0726606.1 hypothetical protein [Chloroflexota bacterium]